MHEYQAARAIGQFVAAVGWVVILLGAILLLVAFGTMNAGFGFLALAPANGIIVGGLLLVCQGQLTQALADTAHNTGQLVIALGNNPSHTALLEIRDLLRTQTSGSSL